jgi:hypothetical protein
MKRTFSTCATLRVRDHDDVNETETHWLWDHEHDAYY